MNEQQIANIEFDITSSKASATPMGLFRQHCEDLLTERRELVESLDSQEFYELMQAYRHAPLSDQDAVTAAFDAVKAFIRNPSQAESVIEQGKQKTCAICLGEHHGYDTEGFAVDCPNAVAFDNAVAKPHDVAAYADNCVNCGRRICRTGRMWYHQSSGGMTCALAEKQP